ncbi:MAG: hypothetical protein R6W70_04565 [bacterium]
MDENRKEQMDFLKIFELFSGTELNEDVKKYSGKKIGFFKDFLQNIEKHVEDGKKIDNHIASVIKLLLSANRYIDIAVLYNHFRNCHEYEGETTDIYPLLKNVMSEYVKDYFLMSLTYSSEEIDIFLHDLLGDNHSELMKIMSMVFSKHRLYNAKFSIGIRRKIVEMADEDLENFLENSDVKFLAFYFSILPRISPLPEDHIKKWTKILLSGHIKNRHMSKIIKALRIRPSMEILFILMLTSETRERGEALGILTAHIKKHSGKLKKHTAAAAYFLQRALMSEFYDFNQIPSHQKEKIASLIVFFPDRSIYSVLVSLLKSGKMNKDPKLMETKVLLIKTLGRLYRYFPAMAAVIREVLKQENIHKEVEEAAVIALKNISKMHISKKEA